MTKGNRPRGKKSKKDSYRSNLEREFAKNLKARSIDFGYENLKLSYIKPHTYNPDFTLPKRDGSLMIIETKGYFPSTDMSKMRAVKKCNPELDIRFIFGDCDKKNKGSKSTYGQWAERNGFPYHNVKIPASWVRELAQ
jgi:hypothetical protein